MVSSITIQKKFDMLSKNTARTLRRLLTRCSSPTDLCPDCEFRLGSIESRFGHAQAASFPIDVVYTWVNGEQPEHAFKKTYHAQRMNNAHKDGLIKGRFTDNDELRYSLRSICKFSPWVNRIFLVTDGQRPAWLNANNRRISLIPHTDIIPQPYLPTFNSHVIESYIHTIERLSEHYIYFNDDCLMTRPCTTNSFFTQNGLPLVFIDWRLSRLEGYLGEETPHSASFFNTLKYLNIEDNFKHSFIAAHGPFAQTKTNAIASYTVFNKIIAEFSNNKFRTNHEIAFYSHATPLLSVLNKRAVPCDVEYYYMNIQRFDRRWFYKSLLKNKKNAITNPLFVCFNDRTSKDTPDSKSAKKEMLDFFEKFLPEKCEFEL